MPGLGDIVNPNVFQPVIQNEEDLARTGVANRRLDYQQERDKITQDLNERQFKLQQDQEARQAAQQARDLAFKQAEQRRQDAAAQLAADKAVLDRQAADRQEYEAAHPEAKERPVDPGEMPKPDYTILGADPNLNYDQPEEIDKLNQQLMVDVASRLQREQGGKLVPYEIKRNDTSGALQPITDLPIDTMSQIKSRFLELVDAGVNPIEASQQAQLEIIGAHPTLTEPQEGKTAYEPGFFGRGMGWAAKPETPAQPSMIKPDKMTLAPKRPTESTASYKMRKKQIDDDYKVRLEDWKARRKAREEWQPTGYTPDWRERDAGGGDTKKPKQPVRKTTKGGTGYREID